MTAQRPASVRGERRSAATAGPGSAAPPAPQAWEPIVDAIGPKVREERRRLGLSLQQLAARSDVSAAAIHKVERGDMVPTITTLLKLAGALGKPVGHFVDEGATTAPVAVRVTADEPVAVPPAWAPAATGVRAGGIAGPGERLRAGGLVAEIEPGGQSGDTRPLRPGEELVLVLEGRLAVEVGGEQHLLRAGDALHYPTDRPHTWRNPGTTPARTVWFTLHS
ncbi:MAG: helix-turn-helix domain-containing protein [Pseudonocardia sp.]